MDPGYNRIKRGKGFSYVFKNKRLTDKSELSRIQQLVIPPAWRNVWICREKAGHIQCTGLDARSRKQYKYHENWQLIRSKTKFYRLLQFGEALPQLRKQLEKDISQNGLSESKVIAAVIILM